MTPDSRAYIAERIEKGAYLIPDYMVGGVQRYLLNGIPPGSFLTAVIQNDLFEAFGRADSQNTAGMSGWIQFFYNYAPSGSWGSPENFAAWLAQFAEASDV